MAQYTEEELREKRLKALEEARKVARRRKSAPRLHRTMDSMEDIFSNPDLPPEIRIMAARLVLDKLPNQKPLPPREKKTPKEKLIEQALKKPQAKKKPTA